MSRSDRLHVGYVVYWGASEALGQTVAVPAVRALARWVDVTLVSFEKPQDRAVEERMEEVGQRLAEAGVRWKSLTYRSTPPVVSSFLDLRDGVRAMKDLHAERGFDLILGRTYVGGLVGALAVRKLRIPFVYYHDACWPEEQVDLGKWSRGSLRDRVAHRLEAVSFRTADGVVVLTRRTLDRLRSDGRLPPDRPAVVAPTTSGLIDRAEPGGLRRPRTSDRPLRLLYVGNVRGRYALHAVLDFASAVRRRVPGSTLSVYSHRDRDFVRREVERRDLEEAVRIDRVEPAEMPDVLPRYDAGMMFLEPGISSPCTTPTKVGEYLAFGLPVVSNRAVGDVPDLLVDERVGVVLPEFTPEAYAKGVEELLPLVGDPDVPRRANEVATNVFDRTVAARRQVELFRRILAAAPERLSSR